jgi:hypothetical protein
MATTRSRVVELSEHSSTQITTFLVLAAACAASLFIFVAAPVLDVFFAGFLRSEVIRDGSAVTYRIAENRADEVVITGTFTTWAIVDPRQTDHNDDAPPTQKQTDAPAYRAEYIFKPIVALAPLVLVGGVLIAALLTSLLPGGLLGQKMEREILVALDRLAFSQYGEHTQAEIKMLTKEIVTADARRLHDLADVYGMSYTDLELFQKALLWREASGGARTTRTHDAIKFYMREYFTDRYSNAILGLVYMGAAVLIIVIGIRGLKFLPATDPSVVLSALGLEFILLVTYAAILMYGRTEESGGMIRSSSGGEQHADLDLDGDTEKLMRAFLAVPRTTSADGDRS